MQNRKQSGNFKRGFSLVRGIMMVIVYVSVAYLLVFTPLFRGSIPAGIRIAFGVIFTAYGILRGYRLWKEQ
ncbi:putative membrane protein [Proteiniphilum saccharofermentans]|uniref:Putative membrane protein n=1 Tax=Proteiniphilum saccharofermentans TaxID=1642647 RepID=A0A1R3T170_9BACT|nr:MULTISPECIES: hypothetical protein [Proteiniphilum]SCD19812.1 putative membrane protein [Proteiniphilum saccharofermentans]SFK92101.1 hypothetical protein SAMN05216357_108113 [Porphyromonadaceae bacterium KH3CP3RA]